MLNDPIILYVEDDKFSRRVIEILLTRVIGLANVTVFDSSENFMTQVCSLVQQPNLFFLDIQIRPHNGYEMLSMLRADEKFKDTTVIALTANVMAHDVDQLKRAGFSGLIGKPIIDDIFPQLVEKILNEEQVWYIP